MIAYCSFPFSWRRRFANEPAAPILNRRAIQVKAIVMQGGRDKSGSCKTRPAFCPDIVRVRLQSPHSSRRDRRSDAELFSRPCGTFGVWSHGPGTGVPGYCPMSLRDKASVPPHLSRPPVMQAEGSVQQIVNFIFSRCHPGRLFPIRVYQCSSVVQPVFPGGTAAGRGRRGAVSYGTPMRVATIWPKAIPPSLGGMRWCQ